MHVLYCFSPVTTPTSSLSDEESVSSKEASVVTTPVKPQPPESISKEKADEPSNDEDSQKASGAQDGSKEKQEEEKENSGFKVMTLQLVLPGVAEPIDILVRAAKCVVVHSNRCLYCLYGLFRGLIYFLTKYFCHIKVIQ